MTAQILLKNIESQIKKSKLPLVILPLSEWQRIEDVVSELSSPRLLKSIVDARNDYKKGKAIPYKSSDYSK